LADSPDKPKDSGKIGLPKTTSAMNKVALRTKSGKDGKGGETRLGLEKDKNSDNEILERAKKRFDRCIQTSSDNRRNALEDLKFKSGDQWPSDVIATRQADKRPCLTINQIKTFVHLITNEERENRQGINVHPNSSGADINTAKLLRGMIRAIEDYSGAEIAYDTAFDNAVSNGFGYFRIITEYEDADSFDQCIVIKRIRNPFTVYLDRNHQEPDGCDCKYAFVTEMIPRDEFKEMHPEADPVNWDQAGLGENAKNWVTTTELRIAEYFEVINEEKKLLKLSNDKVVFEEDLDEVIREQISKGTLEIVDERISRVPKIMWYKLTVKEILERAEWLGRWIPIVPVIGDEIDVEGKVKLSGIIRDAKDPQRMVNYWKTCEVELVALAPKAPFIGAEGQFEGFEDDWKQANTKSFPYLQYHPETVQGVLLPPPQRQPFAGIPAGVVQAMQGARQDMMAVTGLRFDATNLERMNDESGIALRELQRVGNIGASHYHDNLSRALKHAGRILVDLIPKVYNTKRIATIIREDEKQEQVWIDPYLSKPYMEVRDQRTGKVNKYFNPKIGQYAVTVTAGQSYATKRLEASNKMMEFARALPQTAGLIADLIAKHQDWPGAEEMATRLAKALPANLLTPEQKDIPPQIQSMLQQKDAEIKALITERMQLVQALTDKTKDRQQKQDEIDKNFEAKILGVLAKVQQSYESHVGSQIKDLAESINKFMEITNKPNPKMETE